MSSVTSHIAQVGRRINYFIATRDTSGYALSTIVQGTDNNSWAFATGKSATDISGISSGVILQDMGEMAKLNGQVLRKVRVANQFPSGVAATGIPTTYWIVVPGGEYPIQGVSYSAAGSLPVAQVARLG